MQILLCADDTDDVTKAISTGAIVSKITAQLQDKGFRLVEGISRHQLLLNEQIAYTSHNSSMCVALETDTLTEDIKQEVIAVSEQVIADFKAEVSDPGLALCWIDELEDPQRLIDYAFSAKHQVITKDEAYALAAADKGLFLEELGGEGVGVIGALAGVGLRLSRCDGTLRGKTGSAFAGEPMTAQALCQKIKVSAVLDRDGNKLPDDATVIVVDMVKRAYWGGKLIAWATAADDGTYHVSGSHDDIEIYNVHQGEDCGFFAWDNDAEEMRGTDKGCLNCLYRRWLSEGYRCIKGLAKNED